MEKTTRHILTLNAGSSSIKFALYPANDPAAPVLKGAVTNIGVNTRFEYSDLVSDVHSNLHLKAENPELVIKFLIAWIGRQPNIHVQSIGHRVVHGLDHREPENVTPSLIDRLKSIAAFDSDHLPVEIKLIKACAIAFPAAPQVACFDTAFHSGMPVLAQMLPLPMKYYEKGIRRYGFHGLSFEYLMKKLEESEPSAASRHRVILAHLGSGSSLVAVKDGVPIDTTMGFSPTSGVMMGSRTGDLDAGLVTYLLQSEKLSIEEFTSLVNHQSGLLGVSGASSEVLELLTLEKKSEPARLAIDLYCYQVKKAIGSLAAVIGGVDTIVFSGGIGQNSPSIRRKICEGLQYLGIELDDELNIQNAPLVSTRFRNVNVRVIKTDEEWMIAQKVSTVINTTVHSGSLACTV